MYPLHLEGLTAQLIGEGAVVLRDASGVERARIPQGLMWDSHPVQPAPSPGVRYQLVEVGGQPALQVTIDRDWLNSPERVWPVHVDPFLKLPTPTDDTFVYETYPNSNYVAATSLYSGKDGSLKRVRSLLHFDVASLTGKTIDSANLYLYNTYSPSCTYRFTDVWRVTSSWVGNTVTWNTQPTVGEKIESKEFAKGGPAGTSCANPGWMNWQVSEAVMKWLSGTWTNHGLEVRAADETITDAFRRYDSADGANDPYLSVWYYEPNLGRLPYYPLLGDELTDRQTLSVNPWNGNLLLEANDLTLKGAANQDFKINRFHNSRLDVDDGDLIGDHWLLDIAQDVRLTPSGGAVPGNDGESMLFEGPSGYRIWFECCDANGKFKRPYGINATLTRNAGDFNYTVTMNQTGVKYNFAGSYPNLDAVTSIVDSHGNTIRFNYDTNLARLNSITDTYGQTTSVVYAGTHKLDYMTDPFGRKVDYTYVGEKLTKVEYKSSAGSVLSAYEYNYDSGENLNYIKDPNGNVTTVTYDTSDRVDVVTWADGGTSDYNYDTDPATGLARTTVIDQRGGQTKYVFNFKGQPVSIEDPIGVVERFDYNATTGDPTSHTNKFGGAEKFSYTQDAFSNFASATLPTGAVDSFAWTSPSTPYRPSSYTSSQYDDTGQQVAFNYTWNTSLDLTSVKNRDNTATLAEMSWNPCGTLAWSKDAAGNQTTYTNDTVTGKTCRTKTITPPNPAGNPNPIGATTLSYDSKNRIASVQDGKNQLTKYVYDDLDRVTRIEFFNNVADTTPVSTITHSYDGNGNQTSRVDSAAGTTNYGYDVRNRICWELEGTATGTCAAPPAGATAYSWDKTGNLTSLTNGWGTTSYAYDAANRVDSITAPNNQLVDYRYPRRAQKGRDRLSQQDDRHHRARRLGAGVAHQVPLLRPRHQHHPRRRGLHLPLHRPRRQRHPLPLPHHRPHDEHADRLHLRPSWAGQDQPRCGRRRGL